MQFKRNKKAKKAEVKVEAKAEAPKPAKTAAKKPVVNADKMAASIKTTGNDYQQYIRNLFKNKVK